MTTNTAAVGDTPAETPLDSPHPLHGWLTLGGAMLCWALVPVLVKYFTQYFAPVEQNFFRYISSTIFLWLVVAIFLRDKLRASTVSKKGILLATVFNTMYQMTWVSAIYFLMPTQTHLILKINVVFGALLAFIFEPEERPLIRLPRFWIGVLFSLAGACGLILGGTGKSDAPAPTGGLSGYAFGVGLCILGAIIWPSYSLTVKRISRGQHPVIVFTWISTATTLALLAITLLVGDITSILRVPPPMLALVFASGVMAMAVAHALFMIALRHLGVALCLLGLLVSPVFTYAFSYLMLREELTPLQALSVLPLLGGCALAVLRRPK
jgi:drug/metabolite transporter (DMT)-like permease